MKNFTAIYREQRDGSYTLLSIFTADFLRREVNGDWLHDLINELSEGDLWAIHKVEGDSLSDFPDVLDEDSI